MTWARGPDWDKLGSLPWKDSCHKHGRHQPSPGTVWERLHGVLRGNWPASFDEEVKGGREPTQLDGMGATTLHFALGLQLCLGNSIIAPLSSLHQKK